jgi:hypothetical protein
MICPFREWPILLQRIEERNSDHPISRRFSPAFFLYFQPPRRTGRAAQTSPSIARAVDIEVPSMAARQ